MQLKYKVPYVKYHLNRNLNMAVITCLVCFEREVD